jgi:hypothetical protein
VYQFVIQSIRKSENFFGKQAIAQNILIKSSNVLTPYDRYLVYLCYAPCGTMGAYDVYTSSQISNFSKSDFFE